MATLRERLRPPVFIDLLSRLQDPFVAPAGGWDPVCRQAVTDCQRIQSCKTHNSASHSADNWSNHVIPEKLADLPIRESG